MKSEISIIEAVPENATAIAVLRNLAAEDLTRRYGNGPWSMMITEKGVLLSMKDGKVLIAKDKNRVIGTLRLAAKKPWVINVDYFTPVAHTIYLTDMAVDPDYQYKGVGTAMMEVAKSIAREWPAPKESGVFRTGSIRLDAYDAPAGAGGFYLKCGFTDRGHIVYRTVPHIYFEWLV